MRTTIAIDDHLLDQAKLRARQRGLTLGQLIEESLRREFARVDAPAPPIPVVRGKGGLRPGVDLSSNAAIRELMDEGLPLEKRR